MFSNYKCTVPQPPRYALVAVILNTSPGKKITLRIRMAYFLVLQSINASVEHLRYISIPVVISQIIGSGTYMLTRKEPATIMFRMIRPFHSEQLITIPGWENLLIGLNTYSQADCKSLKDTGSTQNNCVFRI